ncbi:carbohydrate binding domain-containing protein, partial [uncultured Ruminococcus sp.]|uniref:carbohydrate binding domain-containing protein n=1 Tax=uncultured Ruminococcus sp. TaxID=165186 RepID=UPI0025D1A5D2
RGAASVSKASGGYNSSNALLCEGRTATWNGAAIALSPAFKAGEAYSFSVNAMSKDGGDTSTFKLTLQYTGSDGQTKYDEIASGTAPKGEWVQLANTQYTIPAGASDMQVYVGYSLLIHSTLSLQALQICRYTLKQLTRTLQMTSTSTRLSALLRVHR